MGYIEEEDDIETERSDESEDGGGGRRGADLGFFNRSFLHARRMASLSGSDSEGNDRRGSSRPSHRSRRLASTSLRSERSSHAGRLASWADPASSGDEAESRKYLGRAGRSSRHMPRGRRTSGGSSGSGSGSDSFAVDERIKSFTSDGSTEGYHRKQLSVSAGKMNKTPGGVRPVAARVTLSAKAAAIMNAKSPPATSPELPTRDETGTEVENANEPVPSVPVDTQTIELSPATPVSPMPERLRKRLSVGSLSLNRPVELDHPVVMGTNSSFNTKVECTTGSRPLADGVGRR